MLFEWKNDYELGVNVIDEQHQKLVALLNELDSYMKEGAPDRDGWVRIFDELLAYAEYHFETEETLMLKHAFGGYKEHKQEHVVFKAKVEALKKGFDSDEINVVDELLYFLMLWLQNHILLVDKECCAFLNEKGVF